MASVRPAANQNGALYESIVDIAVAGLRRVFAECRTVLQHVTEEHYSKAPNDRTPSIGIQMRHILEFFQQFQEALQTFQDQGDDIAINYDARKRDKVLEIRRERALDAVNGLEGWFISLLSDNPHIMDRPATLIKKLAPHHPPKAIATSVLREMTYVLEHASHHIALIAVMSMTYAGNAGSDDWDLRLRRRKFNREPEPLKTPELRVLKPQEGPPPAPPQQSSPASPRRPRQERLQKHVQKIHARLQQRPPRLRRRRRPRLVRRPEPKPATPQLAL